MQLSVSVIYGKGGTGDLFQIESVREAETGRDVTRARCIDVGRHFSDSDELATYIGEEFGKGASFEIDPGEEMVA